jgi:hypothetical protein
MTRPPDLPQLGITSLKQTFRQGAPLVAADLKGFYAGVPAGPWWFRLGSGPTMGLTGFGGWMGKQFLGKGRAVNLFRAGSTTEQRFPMTLSRAASRIDGVDTLMLNYPADARAPWHDLCGCTIAQAHGLPLRAQARPSLIRTHPSGMPNTSAS